MKENGFLDERMSKIFGVCHYNICSELTPLFYIINIWHHDKQ